MNSLLKNESLSRANLKLFFVFGFYFLISACTFEATISKKPTNGIISDTLAPNLTGSISNETNSNSLSQSPLLRWTAGNDAGSGIVKYQVGLGTSSGSTDTVDWTDVGNVTEFTLTGLALTNGITYYPSVRAIDFAGNTSESIHGNGWLVDNAPPVITGINFSDGLSLFSLSKTPVLRWTAAMDAESGVSDYELAIGTTAGASDVLNWTSLGNVTSYQATGLNLNRGFYYYASLRARDSAGNTSSVVQGDGWFTTDEMYTTDNSVNSMLKSGNNLYIGGAFKSVGQFTGGATPVDPSTGALSWLSPTQKTRVSGVVYSAISDGAGGYYIGGDFTSIEGVSHNNLAHILPDGTVSSWNPNVQGLVKALALSGTTLYVGGWFESVNGGADTRNGLASFDTNTGALNAWNPNMDNNVNALAVTGTTLYVGGGFTTVNGGADTRNRLASFDTTTGTLHAWNPNMNFGVSSLLINGTTLYVGGIFSNVGGSSRQGLASFVTTTGALTTWNPGTLGDVYTFTVVGSSLYVGGNFITMAESTRYNLASFNTATGALRPWDPAPSDNMSIGIVNTLASSGTTLYVGGYFTTISGSNRNRIASYDASTTSPTLNSWNPKASGSIETIVADTNRIFLGGVQQFLNGTNRQSLASFDLISGNLNPWNPETNGTVTAMTTDNNSLFIAGSFTTVNSTARNKLASLNLSSGALNTWNPNPSGNVQTLASNGTDLYVGGLFTTISGSSRNRLASYNLSTMNLNSWDPNANNTVSTLLINNNQLYVGGLFTNIGVTPIQHLASFDLTTGNLTSWTPDVNGEVKALAISGSILYVGGAFTTINGGASARNYLASFDTSTTHLTAWNPNLNAEVSSITADSNSIYVSGTFTTVEGSISRSYFAAFNADSGTLKNFNPSIGMNPKLLISDESLFVTGYSFGPWDFSPINTSTGAWEPGF